MSRPFLIWLMQQHREPQVAVLYPQAVELWWPHRVERVEFEIKENVHLPPPAKRGDR